MFMMGRGGPLQCCPVCGQSFIGNGLKHHLKTCARKALGQLAMCQHCGRPVQKEDLAEHAKRCKNQWATETLMSQERKQSFKEKAALLQEALSKIEAGVLCALDQRGLFICSVCGEQGLTLDKVVIHENACRASLGNESRALPLPVQASAVPAEHEGLATQLVHILADLRREIDMSDEKIEGTAFANCCEQLGSVARNACQKEERKYRKLRLSNPAFHEAIGRWPAAVRFLQTLGFELCDSASKGAPPEPRLTMAEPLLPETLETTLSVLAGELPVVHSVPTDVCQITDTTPDPVAVPEGVASSVMSLEPCRYCQRKFRFDRIAKHETRCPASKPERAKYDYIGAVLGGTIGEAHIPAVRERLKMWNSGVRLPALAKAPSPSTGECNRCGRTFGLDSLEKHMRHCRVQTADARVRPGKVGTSSTPRPQSAGRRPKSSDGSLQQPRPSSRHGPRTSASSSSATQQQSSHRASSREKNSTLRRPPARMAQSSAVTAPLSQSCSLEMTQGAVTTELGSCDPSSLLSQPIAVSSPDLNVRQGDTSTGDFSAFPSDLQYAGNRLASAVENEVQASALLADNTGQLSTPAALYTSSLTDDSQVYSDPFGNTDPLTHPFTSVNSTNVEMMPLVAGYPDHIDPILQPLTIGCGSAESTMQPLAMLHESGDPMMQPLTMACGSADSSLQPLSGDPMMQPLTMAYGCADSSLQPLSGDPLMQPLTVAYDRADSSLQPLETAYEITTSHGQATTFATESADSQLQPLTVGYESAPYQEQSTALAQSINPVDVVTQQTASVHLVLPEGWATYQDGEGRTYYGNAVTGESSWLPPEGTQHLQLNPVEADPRLSQAAGYEDLEVDVADWLSQD